MIGRAVRTTRPVHWGRVDDGGFGGWSLVQVDDERGVASDDAASEIGTDCADQVVAAFGPVYLDGTVQRDVGLVTPQSEQPTKCGRLHLGEVGQTHGDLRDCEPSAVELLGDRSGPACRPPHHGVGVDDLPDRQQSRIKGGQPVQVGVGRTVIGTQDLPVSGEGRAHVRLAELERDVTLPTLGELAAQLGQHHCHGLAHVGQVAAAGAVAVDHRLVQKVDLEQVDAVVVDEPKAGVGHECPNLGITGIEHLASEERLPVRANLEDRRRRRCVGRAAAARPRARRRAVAVDRLNG